MPRPTQLPTPQSSTQPAAKDGGHELGEDILLELPPSAFEGTRSLPSSPSSIPDEDLLNDPDYQPLSPTTRLPRTTKKRKSSSARKEHITLPPPPPRTRKIIQMKPKSSAKASTYTSASTGSTLISTSSPSSSEAKKTPKQPAQASRKISRKTAHSLIERRRRGKINDEFEVLKDMIPACKASQDGEGGREMHKLEILKASVEYIRYLKDCVCQLQGDEGVCCAPPEMIGTAQNQEDEHVMDGEEDTDVEMEMEQCTSQHGTAPKPRAHALVDADKDILIDPQLVHFNPNPPPTPKLSSAILPQVEKNLGIDSVTSQMTIPERQHTTSSTTSYTTSSLDERHFSFSSSQSSVASPQSNQLNTFTWRASISSQTSPVMAPLPSQENDATVALLMLNGEWPSRGHMASRNEGFGRGFGDVGKRRGLSVKDLLSS